MGDNNGFERIVDFDPAYDKRAEDCGVHGLDLRIVLKGEKGAIGFVVYTSWMLPAVQAEWDAKPLNDVPYMFHKPLPADLGYHSKTPMYEGQDSREDCPYTDGICYYDGSALAAQGAFALLVAGGGDALWARLEEEYALRFGEKE